MQRQAIIQRRQRVANGWSSARQRHLRELAATFLDLERWRMRWVAKRKLVILAEIDLASGPRAASRAGQ